MKLIRTIIGCLIAFKIVGLANMISWGLLVSMTCLYLIIWTIYCAITALLNNH